MTSDNNKNISIVVPAKNEAESLAELLPQIKQTLTVTGPLKVNKIHCPNCGAIVDPTQAVVVDGKPFVTCSYCGNKFELTEEPTW